MGLLWLFFLNSEVYLTGVWLVRCGCWNAHQKFRVFKRDQRITCLKYGNCEGSKFYIFEGDPCVPFNHIEIHFDNEYDVHMNLENYEVKDYGHDLELAIIKYLKCLSQATRSGCKA